MKCPKFFLNFVAMTSFFKLRKQKSHRDAKSPFIYLKNVATLEFDSTKCKKCKMCLNVCPHGVFTFENNEIKVTDKDKCMECGACMRNCPFEAITLNPGVGCAEAIIYGMLTGKEPKCGCDDLNK